MNINREVGKILNKLDGTYYERGMRKITVPLNGIRNDKIQKMNRKVVIPKLINHKEFDKFLGQFIENLKPEIDRLLETELVNKILKSPSEFTEYKQICEKDKQILALYLLSLHDDNYENVLQQLTQDIVNETNEVPVIESTISVLEKKIQDYQNKCNVYEEKIDQLNIITKQRKEKISELEFKINIITDENNKIKRENEKLKNEKESLQKQIEVLMQQMEEATINNSISEKNQEQTGPDELNNVLEMKNKIVVVSNAEITFENKNIPQMIYTEFLMMDEQDILSYDQIYVYKKGIHISKLRKIKALATDKAVFINSIEEISRCISMLEVKDENRIN